MKNSLHKKYGIYETNGDKLKNSKEILLDKRRFWHPITERVLDRIPNDIHGILLHRFIINGKVYWIVRESEKSKICTLNKANRWVCKELKDKSIRKGKNVARK